MRSFQVEPVSHLEGAINLSGDKSIAHRCVIISAISQGKTTIENFPTNEDCLHTIKAFRRLGIKITRQDAKTNRGFSTITVFGKGLYGLRKPKGHIFVGDSGTTLRLILGILTGQNFRLRLIAGRSLSQRPMLRVTKPLRMMGAKISARRSKIEGRKYEEYPPITIKGANPKAITYRMPIASSQVKSAILLAGLYAKGKTRIIEPIMTRDHTERMLKLFKADIKVQLNKIVIKGNKELVSPKRIYIPGDLSSASFFMVLATILPNAKIWIKNISLNPSRIGIINVLKRMGARIKIKNPCLSGRQEKSKIKNYEPMTDIVVKNSTLKGTRVKKEEIPSLIDEVPILMVAASVARGKTIFEGIGELRVKETDRIRAMSWNLRKMGANIEVLKVGNSQNILINAVKELYGSRVSSFGDHRTAMSMIVAGMLAKGKTLIDDITCINKSFPNFIHLLKTLIP